MSGDESVFLIVPNPAQPMKIFAVEYHLKAVGGASEWVINLGNAIQKITSCYLTVAASCAKDVSSSQILAQGNKYLTTGWFEIKPVLKAGLTPWQLNTLLWMVDGICLNIKAYLLTHK